MENEKQILERVLTQVRDLKQVSLTREEKAWVITVSNVFRICIYIRDRDESLTKDDVVININNRGYIHIKTGVLFSYSSLNDPLLAVIKSYIKELKSMITFFESKQKQGLIYDYSIMYNKDVGNYFSISLEIAPKVLKSVRMQIKPNLDGVSKTTFKQSSTRSLKKKKSREFHVYYSLFEAGDVKAITRWIEGLIHGYKLEHLFFINMNSLKGRKKSSSFLKSIRKTTLQEEERGLGDFELIFSDGTIFVDIKSSFVGVDSLLQKNRKKEKFFDSKTGLIIPLALGELPNYQVLASAGRIEAYLRSIMKNPSDLNKPDQFLKDQKDFFLIED